MMLAQMTKVVKMLPFLSRLRAGVEAEVTVRASARVNTGESLREQGAQIRELSQAVARLHWLLYLVLAGLVVVLVVQVLSW